MASIAPVGQTAKIINIKAFIDAQRITAFQWFLVAICFMIVVADGMDVAIMGFVTPSILKEWDISRPAFGIVISAAPFGLVIGALVAGPSSDRFGRKPVLIVSVIAFALPQRSSRVHNVPPAFERLGLIMICSIAPGVRQALCRWGASQAR